MGFVAKGGWVCVVLALDDFDPDAFSPDGELLDSGCPEGIGGGEHHTVALAFKEIGEFRRGGCLASSVDSDDEDDFRLCWQWAEDDMITWKNFQNFFSCYGDDGFGGEFFFAGLAGLNNSRHHGDAEIGANECFLEFVPVDWSASKFFD